MLHLNSQPVPFHPAAFLAFLFPLLGDAGFCQWELASGAGHLHRQCPPSRRCIASLVAACSSLAFLGSKLASAAEFQEQLDCLPLFPPVADVRLSNFVVGRNHYQCRFDRLSLLLAQAPLVLGTHLEFEHWVVSFASVRTTAAALLPNAKALTSAIIRAAGINVVALRGHRRQQVSVTEALLVVKSSLCAGNVLVQVLQLGHIQTKFRRQGRLGHIQVWLVECKIKNPLPLSLWNQVEEGGHAVDGEHRAPICMALVSLRGAHGLPAGLFVC